MTERRRVWGLFAAAVCIAVSFGLETHNWNDVPEAVTSALLGVGLVGLLALLLVRPRG